MGNRPITIGVETDKAGYCAGNTLRGKVYVSITSRQATRVAAQVLQLRLIGKESAVVHHTSNSDNRTENHYERSSHVFFQVDYPLYTYVNQRAPSGQYEYPFQFNLPENLPSSLNAKDGESRCDVEYELIATLLQPGDGGIFNSNPKGSKKICVWSTTTEPTDSSVQHPADDIPVNGCCCLQKGSMTLESSVSKTVATHNDGIDVQFRCQNNSSLDIYAIKVQLEEVIEWTCNSRNIKVKRILDKKEFYGDLYPELEATLPKPKFCCFGSSYRHIPSMPLSEQFHSTQLQVPEDAQTTYRGHAVTVKHILNVILSSHGCCNSNPESCTMMHLVGGFSGSNSADMKFNEAHSTVINPSAPSDLLDTSFAATPTMDSTTAFVNPNPSAPFEFETPMEPIVAEAHALPPDWNAQTAQVVEIPMVEAMVIQPSAQPPVFK